ncbi:MAG: lytic transglycosylase domain-containing protein [Myxococcales bacterium]|nr:lytic transglycosylase domain-containing protein [Myxococcales bacterium]
MLLLVAIALAEPYATLAPNALELALPIPEAVTLALGKRAHGDAASALLAIKRSSLPTDVASDLAFVTAWELVRAGRSDEAAPLLESLKASPTPPPEYVALLTGEVLSGLGKPADALVYLARVATTADTPLAVRAQLALADAYRDAGRDADARAAYEALAARPDPTPGSEKALSWLLQRVGTQSKEGRPYAERIYRHYPGSGEDLSIAGWFKPSAADRAFRADRLQERGDSAGAVALLGDLDSFADDACVARYAYGRAQNKLNNVTSAASVLDAMATACREKDPDRAAKGLYLAGKSYERKKESGNAAKVYGRLPEWFPTHSMADDGYTLGGIALQESGDLPGARLLWARGMEAYPEGDLAGENGWRLAWGAWLAGDSVEAIRWADEVNARIPLGASTTDVLACGYWAARWRAWPKDNQLTSDVAARALATDRFEALAKRAPWHYYGALATAQLTRLDPARAAALTRPTLDADTAPWQVPDRFIRGRAGQAMLALARVGLVREALAELATVPDAELDGSMAALRMSLETRAGDFLVGHDRLRSWLKTHPPDTLGPNAGKVLRVAYPDKWWPEVNKAAGSFGWDPRLFHALVREESNFNPAIKSHAGACGLSQLMPATAKMVAKKMGRSYSSTQIWETDTNLAIGGYYLDSLLDDYGADPILALASYNAGPGNTNRWLAALPADAPVDTFAETITFRETRHYVKRVTSTWIMYRMLYGEGPVAPDWRAIVVDASPG